MNLRSAEQLSIDVVETRKVTSLAVVFATHLEAAGFVKRMDSHWPADHHAGWQMGYCRGARLYVGFAGLGAGRAAARVRELLQSQAVSTVIFAGFAGALDEAYVPGDMVVAETVIDGISWPAVSYQCDPDLFDAASALLPEERRGGSNSRIVTVNNLVRSHRDKILLGQRYACAAVDTESAGAAIAAAEFGVPFIAIRSIVDKMDDYVSPLLVRSLRPDGSLDAANLAHRLLIRPKQIGPIAMLALQAAKASKSLGRFLAEYVADMSEDFTITHPRVNAQDR